jgi:DNA-directed RNA polymerase specialized sigma24 family protein
MEKISAIYSESYNFVYLRAKSILKREEDIQQLMREVYQQAAEQDIADEKLYKWLGEQTYILGCNKFRKKQVREADAIELEEREYSASKTVDMEKATEIICDTLDELPDMYQATLFAFYFDKMKVKEISAVMGYSEGAILNRLNYAHKYIGKVLEHHQEELKEKVQFSVEAMIAAMERWAKENCMTENVAQNVFGSLCRDLSIKADAIETEDNTSGMLARVAKREVDVMTFVVEEFASYEVKPQKNTKKIVVIAGIAVVLAITLGLLVAVIVKGVKEKKNEKEPPVKQESQEETNNIEKEEIEENEEEQEESKSEEYIFPNSDKELLTRDDVAGMSQEQLRLARNEIFARYGTIFGVQDLADYFGSKSWYVPKITFDEFESTIEMNAIEEKNLAFIIQIEEEME